MTDVARRMKISMAATGILAIAVTSACAPIAAVTHSASKTTSAGAKKTNSSTTGGSVMPTYSSPTQTRVATTHNVSAPGLTAYPWANDQSGGSDPYGLTMRQCVSYAAWYLNAHGTPFGYYTKGPRGVGTFGDASTWDAGAFAAGFTVSTRPLVGSIAQWHGYETSTTFTATGSSSITAGSQGHVAVVTRVYPDGAVDLAQYNLGFNRTFNTLTHVNAPRYIYVPLASPRVP
jgi:surface antigen